MPAWFTLQPQTLTSRSFWLGIFGIISGAILAIKGHQDEGAAAISAGVGLILLRDSISKNSPVQP